MAPRHARIDGLSHRQKEILRLVGQYMQAKEVALKLGISETTVRTHLEQARRRLGVASSREAARVLLAIEREDALLNGEGPQAPMIANIGNGLANSEHEQSLLFLGTVLGGEVNSSSSHRETGTIKIDQSRFTSDTILPGARTDQSGFLYGCHLRLSDRRWAVFERRLQNLKPWQWFGFAFLIAVSMTAVGGGLIQGAVTMFRALDAIQP